MGPGIHQAMRRQGFVMLGHVSPVGLEVDHWQRVQLKNLQAQLPDPALRSG